MSEFSTSKMVKDLSKAAHAEENKGYFEQAETLYKAIVTLEEMAHFPVNQIRKAEEDLLKCEMKGANEAMKNADAYPSIFDLVHPSQTNDNGIFRSQKPSDSNDNGIFRKQEPSNSTDKAGSPRRVDIFLDTSDSMVVPRLHGRPHFAEPAPQALDPKAVMEKQVPKHIPITTDSSDIYPSKGCP